VFNNFFAPEARRTETKEILRSRVPSVDIYETDKQHVIKIEMPGLEKENISINVEDNVLSIKGKVASKGEEETGENRYYRKEIRTSSFERNFTIPADLSHD
jgi:HSP20 family protein